MRKGIAIGFLLLLSFNCCGYRLVLYWLQQQQEYALSSQLAQQAYNPSELVSVKTALHLPYYSSSPRFEQTSGSITLNGVAYAYVMRRVFNDTLELLCLPNRIKTSIDKVHNEWAQNNLTGNTAPSTEKKEAAVKAYAPEFFQEAEPVDFSLIAGRVQPHTSYGFVCLQPFVALAEHPPQA